MLCGNNCNMNIFIIDFDDTLFDTFGYKHARLQALETLGVSKDVFWKTYKEARKDETGAMVYSDRRHAQILAQENFDEEKVFSLLQSVNKRLKDFVYPDTFLFLKTLKKKNIPMILLSLGDPAMQELKVKGSGVDNYFEHMFMVEDTKEHILKKILAHYSSEKAWFINDKVLETQLLHKKFPLITPVLHMSPGIEKQQYIESGLPYFSTLTEILEYVESHP